MSKRRISEEVRQFVAERAGRCCEYCRIPKRYCPDPFSIDHINPRAVGGADDQANLAYCCLGCNNAKHDAVSAIDPTLGKPVELFHPRRDGWTDHFIWSPDFLRMIGKTPKGRATIDRLQLNREGLINLREVLVLTGRHPPRKSVTKKPR